MSRGVYYGPRPVPCECGSACACWHGDAAVPPGRVYACVPCWLAMLASDDPRRPEVAERVADFYTEAEAHAALARVEEAEANRARVMRTLDALEAERKVRP